MKVVKYFILAFAMILILIAVLTCSNVIERVFSQEIASGAVQQFNENTNAYSQISINTGIKDIFIFLSYVIGFIGELLCVKFFIRWIKKDIVSKETK